MSGEKRSAENRDRWPFDPLQPGDHEPARLPEELEQVRKQTGHGAEKPSPSYEKPEEKRR